MNKQNVIHENFHTKHSALTAPDEHMPYIIQRERYRDREREGEKEREQTDVTDPKTDDGQVTMDVERFLVRVGGPSLSLAMGGWVRAKRTSSGMKSLCSDVGNGLLRSTSMLERN